MMNDEKNTESVSDENKTDQEKEQTSVKPAEAKEVKETTESAETPGNVHASATHEKAQHPQDSGNQNGSGGTIPPADHPAAEKKSHGIWKKILMYVLVFLVAGCGAFAGSYAAEHVYHEKMEKEAVSEFGNFGNMMPFGGNNSESTSSGPALGITIEQTDDGIEIVGFATNGNAEKAGLKTGDIIKEVDGKSYDSVSEISAYISSKNVGDTVKVTVSRNGEEKTYSVKLVKKDLSSYSMPSAPSDDNRDDQDQPKALPGTNGDNSQLQG